LAGVGRNWQEFAQDHYKIITIFKVHFQRGLSKDSMAFFLNYYIRLPIILRILREMYIFGVLIGRFEGADISEEGKSQIYLLPY